MFPAPIQKLINDFCVLPGVGRKTAERFVLYLLKRPKNELASLIDDLSGLHKNIFRCAECGNYSMSPGLCPICQDSRRDKQMICVVEEAHDLYVLESTNQMAGVYHVLGGLLNPIEGLTEDKINIKKLLERVAKNQAKEVIIALNPDLAGETTTLYLKKILSPLKVKITRLARGLPMGSDIEYADEITLSNALLGRKEI